MKVGFIDVYRPGASLHKDPVSTPLELASRGHDIRLISTAPGIEDLFEIGGLPVEPIRRTASAGWRQAGFDLVVALSRFAPSLTDSLREIKAAGVPLIVKGDTDGTLGYPLQPNYLRMVPLSNAANVLRHVKWRLPVRRWVGQKLDHVRLADRVVVESPGAAANLVMVMKHWSLGNEVGKVQFIPNQVSRLVIEKPVNLAKSRLIAAIGRWDDPVCKGADLLAATIRDLFRVRVDYEVKVIGSGIQNVRRHLSENVPDRVLLLEEMSFDALQQIIAEAQMLLVPSRIESYSFVSAEALCAGASLVTTPIESLNYLSGGGIWGTVARDFTSSAISAALLSEIGRWNNSQHDPRQTAAFWRARVSPVVVADLWEDLIECTLVGKMS